jgi:hypothetical protein
MAAPTNTTEGAWTSFDTKIQDNSDTFSYTAAHPDHTLIVAGPPRFSSISNLTAAEDLATIGSLQSVVMSSAKPWQPYQPIGQISSTFLGSKTQNQAQISRLLANGPNLLKSLYSYSTLNESIPDIFNSEAGLLKYFETGAPNFWINLDNPLFHVPIGLGFLFRNKVMQGIGGVYMELAVIQSFQTQVQMGQAMILENVGLIFDRAIPLAFTGAESVGVFESGFNLTDAGFADSTAAG